MNTIKLHFNSEIAKIGISRREKLLVEKGV